MLFDPLPVHFPVDRKVVVVRVEFDPCSVLGFPRQALAVLKRDDGVAVPVQNEDRVVGFSNDSQAITPSYSANW